MSNALFALDDPLLADDLAARLVEAGISRRSIRVFQRGTGQPGAAADQIDEQATGGLVTNLLNLFQGVFDWGSSPHDAAAYEEVVRLGGAVVSVDAAGAPQRDAVERLVDEAGCLRRTPWSEAPAA